MLISLRVQRGAVEIGGYRVDGKLEDVQPAKPAAQAGRIVTAREMPVEFAPRELGLRNHRNLFFSLSLTLLADALAIVFAIKAVELFFLTTLQGSGSSFAALAFIALFLGCAVWQGAYSIDLLVDPVESAKSGVRALFIALDVLP